MEVNSLLLGIVLQTLGFRSEIITILINVVFVIEENHTEKVNYFTKDKVVFGMCSFFKSVEKVKNGLVCKAGQVVVLLNGNEGF